MTLGKALKLNKNQSVISICGGGGKTSTLFSLAEELKDFKVLITTTTKIMKPQSSELFDLIIEESSLEFIKRINSEKTKNIVLCGSSTSSDSHKLKGCSPAFVDDVKDFFDYVIIESDGSAGRPIKAPALHEPVICNSTNIYIGVIGLDCLGQKADTENVHRPELFSLIRGKNESDLITENDLIKLINHPLGLFKNIPEGCRRIVLLNKADLVSDETGKRIAKTLANGSEKPLHVVLNSFRNNEAVIFSEKAGIVLD